jgi:hypothetical protein
MDAADESRPPAAFLIHASAVGSLSHVRSIFQQVRARSDFIFDEPLISRFTRAVQGGEFHPRLG